ncbi:hypothetical protein TIFTF001_012819 [Ficus carica]|uniref:Uncharacterized protein n=1 Tax=Ficus carica TaxID=3494 RepID=A0AA88ACZ6_FICCA|nr:hypothetical protein TIFTF001_012819 [Ficus carica]
MTRVKVEFRDEGWGLVSGLGSGYIKGVGSSFGMRVGVRFQDGVHVGFRGRGLVLGWGLGWVPG